jgi:hypothetical protein
MGAIAQPMLLTDAQVRGFLDAVDELRQMGGVTAAPRADPGRPEAFARAFRLAETAEPVLQKHGFADVTQFQQVAYNVAMAYGVLRQGGSAAVGRKMDRAQAEQERAMERMRERMGPEQAKVMEERMKAGMATARGLREVPEPNLELVAKYQDRIAKLRAPAR